MTQSPGTFHFPLSSETSSDPHTTVFNPTTRQRHNTDTQHAVPNPRKQQAPCRHSAGSSQIHVKRRSNPVSHCLRARVPLSPLILATSPSLLLISPIGDKSQSLTQHHLGQHIKLYFQSETPQVWTAQVQPLLTLSKPGCRRSRLLPGLSWRG